MKKTLILILSACLILTALPLLAAGEEGAAGSPAGSYELTLWVGETPERHSGITSYTLPTPGAQSGRVFAGWRMGEGEGAQLYPAGATLTLTADTALTAVFVGMQVLAPELHFYGDRAPGMRFLTAIHAADYAALSALTEVELGTLVVSRVAEKELPGITAASLAAAGKKLLDIKAGGFYRTSEETLTLAGSVQDMHAKNLTSAYFGVGYLSLTYADGSTARIYAQADRTRAGRYYQLLCGAAADASLATQEKEQVSARLASIVSIRANDSTSYSICEGSTAFTISYVPNGTGKNERDDGRFQLRVKQDSDFRFDRDMFALIMSGACLTESSYEISEEGKLLSIPFSNYSKNY